MAKRIIAFLPAQITIFAIFLFLGSGNAFSMDTLVIPGTGDSQSLLRSLAENFMKQYPEHEIIIPDSIGSGGGIKSLLKKRSVMARTARPLKDKEQDGSLVEHPFALSPIVVATHRSVAGVENLSSSQIVQIYSGKIRTWEQVGGPDEPIYPVDREPGDSSRTVFEKKLKGFKGVDSVAKVFFSTPETVEAISSNRNTIGYVPIEIALSNNLHIISIDRIDPASENILNGTYPYFNTFFLVTRTVIPEIAEQFLDFTYNDGSRLIREKGLIPLKRNAD